MLSIVYITCNRAEELSESIHSCEKHVSVEHEYVVIDNGSTDNTEEKINEIKRSGINVRYLKQEKNRGVSGGRNVGYKEAYGEICYFIDDDATIISEGFCLDAGYQYMLEHPNVLAMGTDCYDTEKKCQLVGFAEIGTDINTNTKIRNYIGCSHFIRKSNRSINMLYPDNLMYGSEEMYGGLGCYKEGGIVVQFPALKVLHCPSNNTREKRELRKRHSHINIYVIKKYLLPFPYSEISKVMFVLRIIRFEKCNLKAIIADFKTVKVRFVKEYSNKLSCEQVKMLIKWFGFKQIL